ncbi:MAG: nuclear transport factor 2 family protein [Gemmatimonadota bacterium]
MRKPLLSIGMILAVALGAAAPARGQTAADSSAIRQAALDYAEGYYTANAERMEKALHPELAKRIVRTNDRGQSSLGQMGALTLVMGTRAGGGSETPEADRIADVQILDIFENAASVRTEMSGWVDYMHLGKWNGEWKIVNVLWALKPETH